MTRVATRYLVAIVILIIIAVIVIFLIYVIMREGSWDCTKCKTQFTTWCSECYLANVGNDDWSGGNNLGDELFMCVVNCGYWPNPTGPNQRCENAEEPCTGMIIY